MNNFIRKPSNPEGETILPEQETVKSGDLSNPQENFGNDENVKVQPVTEIASGAAEIPHIEHVLSDMDPISGDPRHQELLRQLTAEIQKGGEKAGLNFLLGKAVSGENPAMIEELKNKLIKE